MQKLHTLAQRLRKNQTEEETFVWSRLRGRRFSSFKFRRQFVIENYIVDFACLTPRIVIELDGSQHAEPVHQKRDQERDKWLAGRGFEVFRFANHQIHEDWDTIEDFLWLKLNELDEKPQHI